MKNAQQKRRDKMNQPKDWGFVVDHAPGQMPKIVNVDALLHVYERLLASLGKLKQRAQVGGQARAETFRDQKEQAQQIAGTIWSVQPDLSCQPMASTIAKRAGQSVSARTIRRWIAPLRPSTQ